jgi:hypothetical protein
MHNLVKECPIEPLSCHGKLTPIRQCTPIVISVKNTCGPSDVRVVLRLRLPSSPAGERWEPGWQPNELEASWAMLIDTSNQQKIMTSDLFYKWRFEKTDPIDPLSMKAAKSRDKTVD